MVEKGAPLVRFDRVRAEADLSVAMAKKAAFEITMKRLKAFIEDREPDFLDPLSIVSGHRRKRERR